MIRAYRHSCGGYYATRERADGSHWHAPLCVRSKADGSRCCYDAPELALRIELENEAARAAIDCDLEVAR